MRRTSNSETGTGTVTGTGRGPALAVRSNSSNSSGNGNGNSSSDRGPGGIDPRTRQSAPANPAGRPPSSASREPTGPPVTSSVTESGRRGAVAAPSTSTSTSASTSLSKSLSSSLSTSQSTSLSLSLSQAQAQTQSQQQYEKSRQSYPSHPRAQLSSPGDTTSHYNHNINKLQKKSKPSSSPIDPPAKEPKKKRRLFGLLSDSSAPSASTSSAHHPPQQTSPTSGAKGFFGRSISTRSRPLSYQGSASSRSPSATVDKDDDYFPSTQSLRPAPIAEESAGINRSNHSFRHSIASHPAAAPGHFDAPQQALQSPVSSLSSLDAGNLSAPQFHDVDGAGSRPPPSDWSDRGKAPASQYPYSSSAYLNVSDSRPSSRQSLNDPPQPRSPVEGQYKPYHGRQQNSSASVKLDTSREPSPLHQPPAQQRIPSSQSGGNQYGHTLEPDIGKKPHSKQVSMVQNTTNEGRSTPPPSKSKEDLASLDFPQLLAKHEELNDKYRKVKKYYFEKDAQVQQLQNTVAHQRLAQSRTSLDDNEYSNRFQRLDGAINNLAFNVRKDWKAVPPWLSPFVNNDATQKVTKEMTAVGRACISRWLVDEIFDRVFHPALEPGLSASLKIIERNLRRFSPPVNTDEERDSLLTKISNWRLATLDGLHEVLNSPQATDYRNELTRGLVETLTSDLQMNLTSPPPAGLEAGVIGIIELAVGLAANLPLESRDVYVEYILPGIPFNEAYMKMEATLPPLINPGESYVTEQEQHMQQQRRGSADEAMGGDEQGQGGNQVIGGFVGAGPKDKKVNNAGKKSEDERKDVEKVRFAGFMSVMVKGKSMLVKAPVFV